LRALGFVGLAMLALVTSSLQGFHTLGTFSCTIIGLVGGAYCSVRGVASGYRMLSQMTGPPTVEPRKRR
jgi:hypothetical protein